ncbi:hypothetical protein [Gloeocapsa sp. PCC 73106]|uniref:hypothetical protein n=1 Tax=Gloeocapsa sp. PCC 73106 TaxID=102232 RepID=UPI0002ACFCF3|nr:hypothetical protein [Gloeocapsa sp. PCC 73106]ELR98572.1 hypothetical protein GLO73106DRAFT_00024060 [Gloeocapsa sp. PCC 73106]
MSVPTVEQFFQSANWEGRSRESKQVSQPESGLSLRLRLGEFFSRHNWEGKPIIITESTPVTEVLITQTVREFFAYLSWHGKPQIAKMPRSELQKTPCLDSKSADLNLNDLSDLF